MTNGSILQVVLPWTVVKVRLTDCSECVFPSHLGLHILGQPHPGSYLLEYLLNHQTENWAP